MGKRYQPKVLFDVNVVLDVLQHRKPFYDASAALWTAAETDRIHALLASHSITTLFYLMRKHSDGPTAHGVISQLLQVFRVVAIGHDQIADALKLGYHDFEDAVQMAAAVHAGADYIATRNLRNFGDGLVTVVEPATLVAVLRMRTK